MKRIGVITEHLKHLYSGIERTCRSFQVARGESDLGNPAARPRESLSGAEVACSAAQKFTDSTINIGSLGRYEYTGGGNRLTRTAILNDGELRHNNGSTVTYGAGAGIDNRVGARIYMDDQGSFTNWNIEGDGSGTPFTISTAGTHAPGAVSIGSGTSSRNTIQGTGTNPILNLDNQRMQFTGTMQNFSQFNTDRTEIRPNSGTHLIVKTIPDWNSSLSLFSASGTGTRMDLNGVQSFHGNDSTRFEAGNGGVYGMDTSRLSHFQGEAMDGGLIAIIDSALDNFDLSTSGNGLIRLTNVDVSGASRLSGNVQVGGSFALGGAGITYDRLSTDPGRATTVTVSGGAAIDAPIAYSDRGDNRLESTTPIQVNSLLEGAANINAPLIINPNGELNATGSNVLRLTAPGSQNNGEIRADGGRVLVGENVTGIGNWRVIHGGNLTIDTNKDIQGSNILVEDGTLEVKGGKAEADDGILMDIDGKLVMASTLSTSDLAFAMTDEAAWDLSTTSIIEMTGGEGAAPGQWNLWGGLETGGLDLGLDAASHQGDPFGFTDNFSIPTLEIGAGAHVFLKDLFDNGNRGGTGGVTEALYVDTLVFQDTAGLLNLNGLNLYFNNIIGDPGQIINAAVVPVPPTVVLFPAGLVVLFPAGLVMSGWAGRQRRA